MRQKPEEDNICQVNILSMLPRGRQEAIKAHSAARLERGEINEKRLGASACSLYFSAISRALLTIQKGTAGSLQATQKAEVFKQDAKILALRGMRRVSLALE